MTDGQISPHPLDPCDPDQCYQTMMTERTALITARRESEDSLIKTIVQLAAALIALMAGFISQSKFDLSGSSKALFGTTLIAMVLSIIAGLTEHYFASKAYLEQQKLVEDFYQKRIATFADPPSNRRVKLAQLTAFLTFVAALLSLSLFAILNAGDNHVEAQRSATARS